MNRTEFIKFIIDKKSLDKEVFKISQELDNYQITNKVLNKIEGNMYTEIILNSEDIAEIKSAKNKLISTLINSLTDPILKTKSKSFINDLVDQKIFLISNEIKNDDKELKEEISPKRKKFIEDLEELRKMRNEEDNKEEETFPDRKNFQEGLKDLKRIRNSEYPKKPFGQELMINLGYLVNIISLIFYPINIINFLSNGENYYEYWETGFFQLLYFYLSPIINIFEFKILNQLRRRDFNKALENLDVLIYTIAIIFFILFCEGYFYYGKILITEIGIRISYPFYMFAYWYWKRPIHKRYFDSVSNRKS